MPFIPLTIAFSVPILLACLALAAKTKLMTKSAPVPPGPPQEWIFGNARQAPTSKQWLVFASWTNIYGSYIFLKMFQTPYLVINSAKVALDLLEKRSNIYSDRPVSCMATELIGWGFSSSLLPYNELWRQHRKFLHQSLNVRDVAFHREVTVSEVAKFLSRLLKNPEGIIQEVSHLTGSVIMRITYGYELELDDQYVALAEHAIEGLTETFGLGFLVDMFPILKHVPDWMPGAGWKRKAKQWRASTMGILELPWTTFIDKYIRGVAPPCYCTTLLDANGGVKCDPATADIIKQTSATMYAAGADSTNALISSFILAMTLYPEIQQRAQAEIDRVVGIQRLPAIGDRANLPYIECIIREAYRWNPASPLSVPHKLIRNDEYEGHMIPEGTTIIPNIWAMCHDPEMYSDPSSFNPSRFLDLSPERSKVMDPRNFVFGFGRRICPGQSLGENIIFLCITSVLACFDIKRKVVDGKEVMPTIDFPHFVGRPQPFDCEISLRSQEAAALVTCS